jgi:hypothetical protein
MIDATIASQYLIHIPTEEILVCKACKYGLQPQGVKKHLRTKHSAIPLSIRDTLVEYATATYKMLQVPSTIAIPTSPIIGFDCLELINGHHCLECGFLSATLPGITKHCNGHGWTKGKGNHFKKLL